MSAGVQNRRLALHIPTSYIPGKKINSKNKFQLSVINATRFYNGQGESNELYWEQVWETARELSPQKRHLTKGSKE
jgi:hypothetical protein